MLLLLLLFASSRTVGLTYLSVALLSALLLSSTLFTSGLSITVAVAAIVELACLRVLRIDAIIYCTISSLVFVAISGYGCIVIVLPSFAIETSVSVLFNLSCSLFASLLSSM